MKQKGRSNYIRIVNSFLTHGCLGLKINSSMRITKQQLLLMDSYLSKSLSSFLISSNLITIINHTLNPISFIPYTSKGILIRMGKGKGKFKGSFLRLSKNTLVFEFILHFPKNSTSFFIYYSLLFVLLSRFCKKFPSFSIKQ